MMDVRGVLGKLAGFVHISDGDRRNGSEPSYSVACSLVPSQELLLAKQGLLGLLGPKKGEVRLAYMRLLLGGHDYLVPYIEIVNAGITPHATAALVPEYCADEENVKETGLLRIRVLCPDLAYVFPALDSPASMLEKIAASCGYAARKDEE